MSECMAELELTAEFVTCRFLNNISILFSREPWRIKSFKQTQP